MARGAAAETSPSVWRYWAARLTLQRAILQEQFSDLQGRRDRAEKRAKAAEIIAQEANAARMKSLLDAAREQATVKTIESAEQRFADARGDFEAAHEALLPAADAEASHDGPLDRPMPAHVSNGFPVLLALTVRPGEGLRTMPRAVIAGAAAVVIAVSGAIYLLSGSDDGVGTATAVRGNAPSSNVAAIAPRPPAPSLGKQPPAPVEPAPSSLTGHASIVAPEPVVPRPAEPVAPVASAEPAAPPVAKPVEPAAPARPAAVAEAAPARTAAEIPPVPPAKPAFSLPEVPPRPRPNPFRFEMFAEPRPAPAPEPENPPFRLPE